jgi:hypothetical protein
MQVEDAFGRLFSVPVEYNWEVSAGAEGNAIKWHKQSKMLDAVVKARLSHGPGHEFIKKVD